MKRLGNIAACLAGSLVWHASLHAGQPDSTGNSLPDNPYAAIVVRNIFGLVPPPPPPDPAVEAAKDLPKITPTGIMTVFGHSQVLYKVAAAPAKPGQPPTKDNFYILSQGQRQDDIEVIKIDEANSTVTFNNHGFTQELPLVSTPASSTPAPGSPARGMNPAMARFQPGGSNSGGGGFAPPGSGTGGFSGGMGGGNSGFNNNAGFNGGGGNSANNGAALNFGASSQGRIYQPEPSTLSPEAAIIAIEAERAALLNNPHPPYPPALLPPTPLTHLNTPGGGSH